MIQPISPELDPPVRLMSGVPWKVRRRNRRLIEQQMEQNDQLRYRARSTRLRTLKAVYRLLREDCSRQAIQEQIVRWIREETNESGPEDP